MNERQEKFREIKRSGSEFILDVLGVWWMIGGLYYHDIWWIIVGGWDLLDCILRFCITRGKQPDQKTVKFLRISGTLFLIAAVGLIAAGDWLLAFFCLWSTFDAFRGVKGIKPLRFDSWEEEFL